MFGILLCPKTSKNDLFQKELVRLLVPMSWSQHAISLLKIKNTLLFPELLFYFPELPFYFPEVSFYFSKVPVHFPEVPISQKCPIVFQNCPLVSISAFFLFTVRLFFLEYFFPQLIALFPCPLQSCSEIFPLLLFYFLLELFIDKLMSSR